MTLALHGKSKRRQGALIFTGFMAVLVAVLAAVASMLANAAEAATTVPLNSDHVGATNPPSAGDPGNGSCPTPPAGQEGWWGWHFVMPSNKNFASLSVTFQNAGTKSAAPFPGTTFIADPDNSHAYVWTPGPDTLQSGTSTTNDASPPDKFNLSHVCAGADPESVVTIEKTHENVNGSSEPYSPGEEFHWVITVKVEGSDTSQTMQIVDTWDDTILDLVSIEPSGPFENCGESPNGTVTCDFASDTSEGSYSFALHMGVRETTLCGPTTNNVVIKLNGQTVDSASDSAQVAADCGQITINKDDNAGNAVAGATFRLENSDTQEVLCVTDNAAAPTGSCGAAGWTGKPDTNPANGVVVVTGLSLGNWHIFETQAPAGYGPDTCGGERFPGTLTAAFPNGSVSGAGCGAAAPTTAFHNPPLTGVIRLCKIWAFNAPGEGSDGSMSFTFDASDSSEETPAVQAITIPGVTEGDPAGECVLLSVSFGIVNIDEQVPAGFLTPDWEVDLGIGTVAGTGNHVGLLVDRERCLVAAQVIIPGSDAVDLVRSVLALVAIVPQGEPICTVTFTNYDEHNVSPSGNLRVEKYLDINGDGDANDPGEGPLSGWSAHVTGDDVNGDFLLDEGPDANVHTFAGLESNDIYHVTEANVAGFTVTNATVNGVSIGASTFAATSIPNGGTTVIQFFNKPLGRIIIAHKVAYTTSGNLDTLAPNDDDGWLITVSSKECGVSITIATDTNGNATFTNLPLCTDYVVSENPVNASSPGFVPSSPTSFGGQTPSDQTLTFVNKKPVFDPPCSNCRQETPVPPTPANTPVPPTATPTTPPTQGANPPVTQIAGEKTPGPATPIAPSTGGTPLSAGTAGVNLILLVGGLLALASGLSFVALGRKRGARR